MVSESSHEMKMVDAVVSESSHEMKMVDAVASWGRLRFFHGVVVFPSCFFLLGIPFLLILNML